jgi:hypothetical protein
MNPYVIGYPDWSSGDKQVFSSGSGFPIATYGQDYTFPTATILPLDVSMTGAATPDQNALSSVLTNLSSLMKLKPVSDIPPLLVYFIPENSFSETFSNNLQDSFLAEFQPTASKIGQTLQMIGVNPTNVEGQLLDEAKSLFGGEEGLIGKLGGSIIPFMAGLPFQWPKIWTGSAGALSYTIKTILHCTSPNDDSDYLNKIVIPLFQLLRYVLPRSIGNGFYQWPYFCSVSAPGLFNLPKAMISNLVIERGPGGVFTMQTPQHKYNRPSIVNIEITFTSIYDFVGQQGSKGQVPEFGMVQYISGILGTNVPQNMKGPTSVSTVTPPGGTVPGQNNNPGRPSVSPSDTQKRETLSPTPSGFQRAGS